MIIRDRLLHGAAVGMVALAAVVCGGCGSAEAITLSTEPADPVAWEPPVDLPEDPAAGVRIIGAIIPQFNNDVELGALFFKMQGGPETIGKRLPDIERFLTALVIPSDTNVPNADALTKNLPKGWTMRRPTNEMELLAIQTGHRETPAYLKVSLAKGSLIENVNRWRGQVGLAEVSEAELPKSYRELKTGDGRNFYLVDIKGPGGKSGGMRVPPFAGR